MISEPYRPGQTMLHRVDVRIKLIATGGLVCVASLLHTTQGSLAALGVGLSALTLARVSPAEAARRLAPANGLLLMLAASLALTYPGTAWEPWPMVRVEGAVLGLRIAIKSNAALCLLLALSRTSSVAAMAHGLRGLGLPEKLVLLLAFSYRQIFVTADEWERRRQALAARCFTPRMSLHTWRTIAILFGQTLLGSLDRAERIRDAMRARCFDGVFHVLQEPSGKRTETVGLALTALLCGVVLLALDQKWI
ncbi:cobalt/nickel transport system permease protein [Desulfomicrobium macestii]|uniref:Cobalt/nickel transport system permease protein n=1 Tax=Desulfomicrobium macestii TaxID=90731 RepID=A0ABR9H686_9BACT|nr:energy-coupling factor transporter transmembrane component T [Desulfomicrobium macestii]MBE1426222.1 cobalt/nickel transport system permease protein [Desulfomicrobium macestii]